MWTALKFIVGLALVLLIASLFFGVPLSLARLENSIDQVIALVPHGASSDTSASPTPSMSAVSISPVASPSAKAAVFSSPLPTPIPQKSSSISAPAPLQVSGSAGGALTRSGVRDLTNEERAKEGEAALADNPTLDGVADAKLKDLFAKQYFEHISPTGVGPAELAKAAGYDYLLIGENLALGNFRDDAALVAAWMGSPGHRANILKSQYTEIGVAVGMGTYKGESVWIAVQSFGLPASACPEPSASLKASIDTEKSELDALQQAIVAKKAEADASQNDSQAYGQKVSEYNALVAEYNTLVETTKNTITDYNASVNASNACVEKNTAS